MLKRASTQKLGLVLHSQSLRSACIEISLARIVSVSLWACFAHYCQQLRPILAKISKQRHCHAKFVQRIFPVCINLRGTFDEEVGIVNCTKVQLLLLLSVHNGTLKSNGCAKIGKVGCECSTFEVFGASSLCHCPSGINDYLLCLDRASRFDKTCDHIGALCTATWRIRPQSHRA